MMKNKYYVYALIDSSTDKPFYIGKGSGNRMYYHEKAVKLGTIPSNNRHLFYKIKKLIREDIGISYVKFNENMEEQLALDYEEKMIEKFGIDNLCNIIIKGRATDYTKPHKTGGFKKGCTP
jgi:uncharacterized protein